MITTFIDILNEVCLNIFQAPLAGLNVNTQAHLKNTTNNAYRDLCNLHKDWLFLNRMKSIQAWTPNTDANHTLSIGTVSQGLYTSPLVNTGNTVYMATNQTNANDFPIQFNSTAIIIAKSGLNAIEGISNAMICPDKNGSPDLDNYYGISDNVILNSTITTGWVWKTFTFSTPTAIPKSCNYWIVVKFKATATGYIVLGKTGEAVTNKTYNPAVSNAWVTNTGSGFRFISQTYYAEYSNVLSVGTDIQEVLGFYDNTLRNNRVNSLIEIPQKTDSERMNDDSFEVVRNTNGTWTVNFLSTSINPLSWLMEYKIIPTDMFADADVPSIPAEFRSLIVTKSILKLRAEGRGLNSPDNLQLVAADYTRELSNMEMAYRPDDLAIEPDINAQGFTPRGRMFSRGMGDKRIGRVLGRRL